MLVWFNVNPFIFRLIHCFYVVCALYLLCGFLRYFILLYWQRQDLTPACCTNAHCSKVTSSNSANVKRSNSRRTTVRQNSTGIRNEQNKFVQIASSSMAFLSITAGLVTFVHILLDLWVFSVNTKFSLDMLCVRQKWSGVMLFWNFLCVYLFLWIRQRVFYSHPVLRSLSKPILNRFSWSVLFAIIFSITTFAIAYYLMPGDYQPDSREVNTHEYFVFGNASTWRVFTMRHDVSGLCFASRATDNAISRTTKSTLYLNNFFFFRSIFDFFPSAIVCLILK